MQGRTENNRVVNFTSSDVLPGQFVEVEITEALNNSLRGELVSQSGLIEDHNNSLSTH
jgi:tRNA-2-methylthio-N6-dimethylallyladenosine synthase